MRLQLRDGRHVDVEICKKHIKNMTLRLYPDGKARVSAPAALPNRAIWDFLKSKQGWIEKRVSEHAAQTEDIGKIKCRGRLYERMEAVGKRNHVTLSEHCLHIEHKEQSKPFKVLDVWWREQAAECFNGYVDQWMAVMAAKGIARPCTRIRKMKTLWGSCTCKKGEIRFNYYLLCAPPACIEYVVLHELAHLLYPNHGKRFKAFLTKHMPDWKARRRELNASPIPSDMFYTNSI